MPTFVSKRFPSHIPDPLSRARFTCVNFLILASSVILIAGEPSKSSIASFCLIIPSSHLLLSLMFYLLKAAKKNQAASLILPLETSTKYPSSSLVSSAFIQWSYTIQPSFLPLYNKMAFPPVTICSPFPSEISPEEPLTFIFLLMFCSWLYVHISICMNTVLSIHPLRALHFLLSSHQNCY